MSSISEIAKKLNLSPSTVSRALKNPKMISLETRSKVLKEAERSGYLNKLREGVLKTASANIVGIIVADLSNIFNNAIVKAVTDVLSQNDYNVVIGCSYEDPQIENRLLRQWLNMNLSGLIVMPTEKFSLSYKEANLSIPVVQVDRAFDGINADSVTEDNRFGASIAVEYLLSLKHRRIAFISGDDSVLTFSQRSAGSLEMGGSRVEICPLSSKSYEDLYIGGFEKTNFLMLREASKRPTAIIGANNAITAGVVYALNLKGIKIPDGVSVMSYGDNSWCRFFPTPITAIVQPVEQMGHEAASLLLERIRGLTGPSKNICLKSMLLTRASTVSL